MAAAARQSAPSEPDAAPLPIRLAARFTVNRQMHDRQGTASFRLGRPFGHPAGCVRDLFEKLSERGA
jgi:hypothetical protein